MKRLRTTFLPLKTSPHPPYLSSHVFNSLALALLTTIFGIIVALILQVFYNYILSKIEHITSQMEESAITLLDSVMKYKLKKEC